MGVTWHLLLRAAWLAGLTTIHVSLLDTFVIDHVTWSLPLRQLNVTGNSVEEALP